VSSDSRAIAALLGRCGNEIDILVHEQAISFLREQEDDAATGSLLSPRIMMSFALVTVDVRYRVYLLYYSCRSPRSLAPTFNAESPSDTPRRSARVSSAAYLLPCPCDLIFASFLFELDPPLAGRDGLHCRGIVPG